MIFLKKKLGSTHGKSIYNQSQAIKSNTIMWLKKKGTWNQLVDNQSKVFKFNIKHVTLKKMVTWIQLMSHINFIIMKLITQHNKEYDHEPPN